MHDIDYSEIYFKYKEALETIKPKIEIMCKELNQESGYDCVEYIKTRIKTENSIINKMKKNNYEINKDNLSHIHDIAGIRIVCTFLNDIEKIEQTIKEDKDLKIKRRKDYITNPKENGYSSLHLNVEIPVELLDKKEYVEVEIQIRTIAMDLWATLEHKLCYKNSDNPDPIIKEKLKVLSKAMNEIDKYIDISQNNNEKIDNNIMKRILRKDDNNEIRNK